MVAALVFSAFLSLPFAPLVRAGGSHIGSPLTAGPDAPAAPLVAASIPTAGFSDSVVWAGLTSPVAMRFASDGRIFVAEKSGLIKVFDNLADPTADDVCRPAGARRTTTGTAACSG